MSVKLDLFHACQRVTRATGKRSLGANFQAFSKQLSNCFKQVEDHNNENREMATPCEEEIIRNLNDLLQDWKPSLNKKGIYEIEKLRDKHSACLANIPAHSGTNRNENIHKILKSFFKNIRNIGLEKFIALLTTALTEHNRSISNNETPLITMPIVEIEKKPKKVIQYVGFGVSTTNENEEILGEENFPDEYDFQMARSFNNLMTVNDSLTFKTTAINGQGVIISSPYMGHQLFTNLMELSRCLSQMNCYIGEKLEKPLHKALLIQFKYTIDSDETLLRSIGEKVSYE